jgi:hypothetical protein
MAASLYFLLGHLDLGIGELETMYDAEVNFSTSWRGHWHLSLMLYPSSHCSLLYLGLRTRGNYPELVQEISLALQLARSFGE